MDVKTAVFNAARDGNLTRLKVYLHSWRTADELSMAVGGKVGGATPLVIACRNGHYDVAEYLIERCKADIEQPGSVTFDGETIEGAPPLWCAAAAGHLALVRLLVRAGARVNSTTRTHSTPLRAACFDGHYEIVKYLVDSGADIEIANRHGHTCLMIACYKGHIRIARYLLGLRADVNRKSVKGNTALHDCAESGSLHILKLLLEHGATMDVDSYGMTPLLAASVTGHNHIVEHLIGLESGAVSRQARIDALELLGATYVDKRRDMVGALQLWKKAMDDRFPADGIDPIPKRTDVPHVEAYDYTAEALDAAQLDELLADPDAMRMQALVIRERILGRIVPPVTFEDISPVFTKALSEIHRGCVLLESKAAIDREGTLATLQRVLVIALHLAALMARLLDEPECGEETSKSIHEVVYMLVKLDIKVKNGRTALHLACSEEATRGRSGMLPVPAEAPPASASLVGLMLRVGADPNVRDAEGNTPLHLVAKIKPCPADVVTELLQKDAHIDTVNYDGATFADVLKQNGQNVWTIVNPLKFTSLKCLAARTVKNYRLPYKNTVPRCLHHTVITH